MTVIEEIKFSGNDEENIREICSSHVRVYPSAKSALDCRDVSASCKISIQPAVKYFWEYQYYVTRLIARHHASSLIAYAIKHVKKTDSDEDIHVGMVRLLNTETGKKLLLRSFTDRITYIDFALRSEALLGILDHSGAVNVFKISIQPAVKYFWEYQYYVTRLIARHHASSLIAYAIKHVKKTDSDEDIHVGMVRLLNTETGKKLLLRSFTDRITYIDFALRSEALLGILDHSGAVNVFKIDQGLSSEDPMTSSLFFSLNPPENFVPLDISSLVWCPWLHGSKNALPLANDIHDDVFVPPRDPSLLLAYSTHHKVKVINVGLVVELLQNHFSQDVQSEVSTSWSEKQLIDAIEGCTADSLYYAELSDHSDAITALSLSRDATCLGSASLDGKVCIYSLVSRMAGNMKYKLRPIHVFSPHGGLPLYALIFLDNVLHNDESITWSYLLTGAESNREIRLWSCSDWSCLQVIQFCSVIPSTDLLKSLNISLSKSSIILAVDQSASFLIATDVTRRVLYTLELAVVKDVLVSSDNERSLSSSSSSMLSVSKKICCFISIGEFLLTTPCLLFALGPSSRKAKTGVDPLSIKEKIGSHKVLMDQICLDIHIIHNRNLLNGTIRFDLPHRSESGKLQNYYCNYEIK
ncbi:enhancer of mRNA-decapping protein 4 [Schistosoma bovis]|uniref:Enhancer of mRNA-decapping protein 4 n=1 Tax=Schistosoma bovis TaxID=6184 RepID=A0A430QLK2_SCHBO|nr:enhancer of mRNA-decapping protein 4 [Schistosoma bovis]